jgi:hypothetical protein
MGLTQKYLTPFDPFNGNLKSVTQVLKLKFKGNDIDNPTSGCPSIHASWNKCMILIGVNCSVNVINTTLLKEYKTILTNTLLL